MEQKREWTLQIKRVMLENYNAVIPIHARQLVLQLGQTHHEDENTNVSDRGSAKKLYSAPPEYLERRKLEKERRRSEAGIRQKLKKTISSKTPEPNQNQSTPDSPASSRKSTEDPNMNRDRSLNRSLDGRTSKVKDRFTNWRRKSEPGFQSYISLNQSDDEKDIDIDIVTEATDSLIQADSSAPETANSASPNTSAVNDTYNNNLSSKNSPSANINTKDKDTNEQQQQQLQQIPQEQAQPRTVEEIVGHILMQNQEFQRLLEKQRNNSLANVRNQRFKKHQRSVDTSDDSDTGEQNYSTDFNNINNSNSNNNNNNSRVRPNRIVRREHRLVRSNNAWNSLSSRDNQPSLQLQYNNLRVDDNKHQVQSNNKINRVQEKKAVFEAFKRQSIVTESKIIKTALRMRDNSPASADKMAGKDIDTGEVDDALCNSHYGVWDELKSERCSKTSSDSPTRPAVWLTKLCQDLPSSPQKSGSLPRSFQINQSNPSTGSGTGTDMQQISKARFLQRDGKPMSERPFTIASDKPAEINIDDVEQRYTTADNKINLGNKFKESTSASFYSVEDNLTDADSDVQTTNSANIHPDHKIYRVNISGSMLKNVLSKAGSRLQGLRSTVSAETLECVDEFDKTKRFASKIKKKKFNKSRLSRESSTDVDEPIGCMPGNSTMDLTDMYYKQGSSGLGARIAQADYADPSTLFFDIKRGESCARISDSHLDNNEDDVVGKDVADRQRLPSDGDNYYEKCFESIENYVDETDDAFRDSAIFSDGEEVVSPFVKSKLRMSLNEVSSSRGPVNCRAVGKPKVAPPVPVKKKTIRNTKFICEDSKPDIALKPDNLKVRTRLIVGNAGNIEECVKITVKERGAIPVSIPSYLTSNGEFSSENGNEGRNNSDVSAGQSQAGWVKKMVGQLQAQIETL